MEQHDGDGIQSLVEEVRLRGTLFKALGRSRRLYARSLRMVAVTIAIATVFLLCGIELIGLFLLMGAGVAMMLTHMVLWPTHENTVRALSDSFDRSLKQFRNR